MPYSQLTKASSRLRSALNSQVLESIGRGTGFLQRLRIITPSNLVPSLIGAMGSGRVESLADLHRRFNDDASTDVAEKSFYDRLDDPGFAPMMKGIFLHLSGVLVNQALRFLPGSPFRRFRHIIIQDGTCFALRNSLADVFPARATATAPAGVEIHTTLDLLTESPIAVAISADTAAERTYLPEPGGLVGSLLLADRGYPSWAYLAAVRDAGGFFLMRLKGGLNPPVISLSRKGVLQEFGEPIGCSALLETHDDDVLDVQIRPRGEHGTFRLVILKTPKGRTFLITNLPSSDFPPVIVGHAYRLRWQVELMYREWKSYANLHRFCTGRPGIVEGLIWAALSAAILKRYLAHAAQMTRHVPISTRKAAMMLDQRLPRLLGALLSGLQEGAELLAETIDSLAKRGRRSKPKREKLIGRRKLGLNPVFAP